MLVKFALAVILLVYASLQTDLNRKCKNKNAVSESESNLLQFVNISMIIVSVVGVLFFGYHLLAPDHVKSSVNKYF